MTVSWNPVSGASRYNIYRLSSSSGSYSFRSDTSYSSYTDGGLEPNTTYYYKVSAYNSHGESAQSSSSSATTL
ncbi:MAG: fibronectin type III domain-containing protein, partial [Treponema sp.]|nr:fibronectin type III domain-containing protein [Treponema sp.]